MKANGIIASIVATPNIFKVTSRPMDEKIADLAVAKHLTRDVYYFYEPIRVDSIKINHATDTVIINDQYEITNVPGEGKGEGYYPTEEVALAVTIALNGIELERHLERMALEEKLAGYLQDAIRLDSEAAKKLKK